MPPLPVRARERASPITASSRSRSTRGAAARALSTYAPGTPGHLAYTRQYGLLAMSVNVDSG
jgi:hypothetical protein